MKNLTDATLTVAAPLPAAGATAFTPAIDLGQTVGGDIENVEFGLSLPDTSALVADKKIAARVQDSDDGLAFADLDPAISTAIVGATGGGNEAKDVRFRVPSTARRHIRVALTADASCGDVTADAATLRLFA